jgi:hypothetical protein
LKTGIAILSLMLLCLTGKSQPRHARTRSDYKYVYSFKAPEIAGGPSIKIDSSINPEGLTSIVGYIKNGAGVNIDSPLVWLMDKNRKAFQFFCRNGKIDTTIIPGNYFISIYANYYITIDTSFSIGNNTTMHFDIVLAENHSLMIYDILSKVKLKPAEVEQIKACFFEKKNKEACEKKGVYFIAIEI